MLFRSGWLSRVVAEVPPPFASLVQQLGVAPIPERDENAVAPYVTGVTSSLIDRGLLARKATLVSRLQRTDSADTENYRAVQRELMELEVQRRRLREG